MTQKIIKGNKLIAEFMGLITIQRGKVKSFTLQIEKVRNAGITDWISKDFLPQLKYHSSWDWLMLVVEKIQSLEYEVSICGEQFGQFPRKPRTFIYFDLKRHKRLGEIHAEGKTTKEATYKAVIEFIKWLNKKYGFALAVTAKNEK